MINNNKSDISVSGDAGFVSLFKKVEADHNRRTELWIGHLVDYGVKAAHPDDGWVDRENNEVSFAYPYFNLRPSVGDTIVLGDCSKCRIVQVDSIRKGIIEFYTYYKFTEIGIDQPAFKAWCQGAAKVTDVACFGC